MPYTEREALEYISMSDCDCTKNGSRAYQFPGIVMAGCVSCFARYVLYGTPSNAPEFQEKSPRKKEKQC